MSDDAFDYVYLKEHLFVFIPCSTCRSVKTLIVYTFILSRGIINDMF